MLRATPQRKLQFRTVDNLSSEHLKYGRQMTGYITPYRHWMWKQNELWRNVHEAQFEHLRRVYKRQWLESWRVNADEYIHKYNITKAATLKQWENEMHAQDARRLDTLHRDAGRRKLKAKHRDLFREIHEREFFHWYERASERLQAMTKIPYLSRDSISEHIDKELNKYVAGKSEPYPLNFVGQMPVLEDGDGNIAELSGALYKNFAAERPTATATVYSPPKEASALDQLSSVVSGEAHGLFDADEADALENAVLDEMAREDAGKREVLNGMDDGKSAEERAIDRRAYIERGKHSTKVRSDFKSSARTVTITPQSSTQMTEATGAGAGQRKKKPAPAASSSVVTGRAARQKIIDAAMNRKAGPDAAEKEAFLQSNLGKADIAAPKVGEIASKVPKLRSRLKMPSMQEVLSAHPMLAAQAGGMSVRDTMKGKKGGKQDPK